MLSEKILPLSTFNVEANKLTIVIKQIKLTKNYISEGSSLDDHIATIIVGLVQLICNALSLLLIDKAGRKPLLIGSGAVMAMAMASMGTAFYLHEHGNDSVGYETF